MRRSVELSTVRPFLKQLPKEYEKGSLSARRKIVWVNIEDDILEEVLELEPLDIYEVVEKFGKDLGLQDHFLDDVNNGVMIAFEYWTVLCSLYKNNLSLGDFSLELHAVFEVAEMPHQLCALEVELFDAGGDLSLLFIKQGVHSSISWSNSSTVRSSSAQYRLMAAPELR